MKALVLSLLLFASPVMAAEPIGAVVVQACGSTYAVIIVMSDRTYIALGAAELNASPELIEAIKQMAPFIANVGDPKLCGVST